MLPYPGTKYLPPLHALQVTKAPDASRSGGHAPRNCLTCKRQLTAQEEREGRRLAGACFGCAEAMEVEQVDATHMEATVSCMDGGRRLQLPRDTQPFALLVPPLVHQEQQHSIIHLSSSALIICMGDRSMHPYTVRHNPV